MPPSGFGRKAVKGLLAFVEGNYQDLEKEVKFGKHKDFKAALKYERKQLKKALELLHINEKGRLVKRKPTG